MTKRDRNSNPDDIAADINGDANMNPAGAAAGARAVRVALGWMVVSCLMFALVMVSIRLFLVDLSLIHISEPTRPY